MEFQEGSWVMVKVEKRLFKGYIFEKGPIKSTVNVYVPNLKRIAKNEFDFYNPHVYYNEHISPLPLDTFGNEKELYIDAALILGCKQTFQEVVNNEEIK